MKNPLAFLSSQKDIAYLILRVVGGGTIFWAGWLKIFGDWDKVTGMMTKYGLPLPEVAGPLLILLEFLGGAAVILGLATRYLGVVFTVEFVIALLVVKIGMGYQAFRIDFFLIAFSLIIATYGAGAYSLDRTLKLDQ